MTNPTPCNSDSSENTKPLSPLPLEPRQIPSAAFAEACLLGSMILSPRQAAEVREIVTSAEMFYLPEHRTLWLMILSVLEETQGRAVDGALVRAALLAHRKLEQIGGLDYLRQVIESTPSAASARYYAKIVRTYHVRRQVLAGGDKLVRMAAEALDLPEILDAATKLLSDLTEHAVDEARSATVMEVMQSVFAGLDRKTEYCLRTGPLLGGIVAGFTAGQMVVIAGRPRHGKTALALHLMLEGQRHDLDKAVAFFSYEMTAEELGKRLLAYETGIPYTKLNQESLNAMEQRPNGNTVYQELLAASQYLNEFDIRFAGGKPTVEYLRAIARRWHREKPLSAIFVDYVQRMYSPVKCATRDREVSIISNGLKNLALELGVPVIVLAQLNRACDQRDDHRPRPSDLRDSGTLEQDADMIVTLWRPELYPDADDSVEGIANVEVIKHRNGPEGRIEGRFDGPCMKFYLEAPPYETYV